MSEPRATYRPGGITITAPSNTVEELTAALLWVHASFAKLDSQDWVEARANLEVIDRLITAALIQAATLEAQKS